MNTIVQPQEKLEPAIKDLGGGFRVRRLLPGTVRKSVGPFVFFDHFGPVSERPGDAHDVRPHPHIGLATVTYLFEGAMMHRDSLGNAQEIRPGAINWMTAGRGIVHSERKPKHLQTETYVNHGLQLWSALPLGQEDCEPAFVHTPAEQIPVIEWQGVCVRVLVGEAFGGRSPVVTLSPTLYLDLQLPAGARLLLPSLAPEMAIYPIDAGTTLDTSPLQAHEMAVLKAGVDATLQSGPNGARVIVVGGAPLDAPRHIVWNFVSSRRERIAQAGADWAAQRMGHVPGETEFIPLPQKGFGEEAPDVRSTPG
ncbi:MAG: pirin family protein [Variovorax sp.]